MANLTRADGDALMEIAARTLLQIHTTALPIEQANVALGDMREGRLTGADVLMIHS